MHPVKPPFGSLTSYPRICFLPLALLKFTGLALSLAAALIPSWNRSASQFVLVQVKSCNLALPSLYPSNEQGGADLAKPPSLMCARRTRLLFPHFLLRPSSHACKARSSSSTGTTPARPSSPCASESSIPLFARMICESSRHLDKWDQNAYLFLT